jgi:hypothetical protein
MLFSLHLLIIIGCGFQSNPKEETSERDDLATNTDINGSVDSIPIAVVLPEPTPTPTEEVESILPQTFSVSFPSVLKKESKEENQTVEESNATIENNQTAENENNQTIENNITVENNQTIDGDGDGDGNITVENNQTIRYCEMIENNETQEGNQTVEDNRTKNIAYEQLKDKVEKIEYIIKVAEVNLMVLERAMPEIFQHCDGMEFNTTCGFVENFFSVVMDNETIEQIAPVIAEHNLTFPEINGSRVQLGEVSYTHYDDNQSIYQYTLSHDMASTITTIENNATKKEQYSFRWSDESEDVMTQYIYEDNETQSKVLIRYLLGEDGKELMNISCTEDNNLSGKKESMSLTLVKNDENGSYSLVSNSIDELLLGDDINRSSFSSSAEISDESSLLLFSGTLSQESLDSNETDKTIIKNSTVVQDNRIICGADRTEVSEEVSDIELYELNITGENLKDGAYLIFAPDTQLEEFDFLEIYELSIGSFTVYHDEIQGSLKEDTYKDMLDELIIVKITDSQESANMFEIVPLMEKPTLKIVKK